jgi:hypothetical protein
MLSQPTVDNSIVGSIVWQKIEFSAPLNAKLLVPTIYKKAEVAD